MPPASRPSRRTILALLALAGGALSACGAGAPGSTPAITPGTSAAPREVILVARDYSFDPAVVDLVPGETIVVRLVNGGLVVHEAIVGRMDVQDAWEAAEAAAADPPPGPTPAVSVAPGLEGFRVVAGSGGRTDAIWTVPLDAASAPGGWLVGCHIPGHWSKGMLVPVRFVGPGGAPLPTTSPDP